MIAHTHVFCFLSPYLWHWSIGECICITSVPKDKDGLDIGQELIGTECDGPSLEPYRILWSDRIVAHTSYFIYTSHLVLMGRWCMGAAVDWACIISEEGDSAVWQWHSGNHLFGGPRKRYRSKFVMNLGKIGWKVDRRALKPLLLELGLWVLYKCMMKLFKTPPPQLV